MSTQRVAERPTAYTPGPWAFRLNSTPNGPIGYVKADTDHVEVAVLYPDDAMHHEGNARLVAAAPDLLDALKGLLPLAEAYLEKAPTHPYNSKIADAHEAIAKAEGRQS